MHISQNGRSIASVEDWLAFAPPKEGLAHWKDGRSAKELAKAFFEPGVACEPPELIALLGSSKAIGQVRLTGAWPEYKIRLDGFRGETRNADLAAVGEGPNGIVAVTIEAKADESFGQLIGTTLDSAPEKSNVPVRIAALAAGLLDKRSSDVRHLRYQLLHAIAATLIFAAERRAKTAIFVVMEFRGSTCADEKLAGNAEDLNAFIAELAPALGPLKDHELLGPICVPGNERIPNDIPLYVGKVVRQSMQTCVGP